MNNIFLQLALILSLASIFGYFTKKFNLPIIISYLLVGITLSALALFNLKDSPVFVLPDIGIAFVLFLIGMELDFREIKLLGKPIIISGLIQITISALAGFTLSNLFGFKGIQAFYLGVGLAFSSTVVIVKLLLDRKDLSSLYGKLSMGASILEDLVALMILMFLSVGTLNLSFDLQTNLTLLILILKGAILIVLTMLFSKYLFAKIFDSLASSPEMLFLTALTWCFVFTSITLFLGFSVMIGGFLSGLALASSPYHYHISGKIRPIRDFFIILFFVYLGSQVNLATALNYLPLITIFVLYAIICKPLIYLLSFGSFGFKKHTIFQAAFNMSQVSEFSLIVILLGVKQNIVNHDILTIMALVTSTSIIGSSILISKSKMIYPLIKPLLNFFETKNNFNQLEVSSNNLQNMENHVVLIGASRVGGPIVKYLKKENIPHLVLDFNPEVVDKLIKDGVLVIYGDLADPDILEYLHLDKAKLIISTSTNLDDNKMLLSLLKHKKASAKVIIRAQEKSEVESLKSHGADYVIFPEDVSADFLVSQLKTHWPNLHFSSLS